MPVEYTVQSQNQAKNIVERQGVKDLDIKTDQVMDTTSQINSNVIQIKEEINDNVNNKIEEVKEIINNGDLPVLNEPNSEVISLLENILEEVNIIKEKSNILEEDIKEIKEEIPNINK